MILDNIVLALLVSGFFFFFLGRFEKDPLGAAPGAGYIFLEFSIDNNVKRQQETDNNVDESEKKGSVRISNRELMTQVPFVVAILNESTYQCTGTLIQYNAVLTTGFCIYNIIDSISSYGRVSAGTPYWNDGGEVREIEDYRMHDNFSAETLDFDIAMLKLLLPFENYDHLKPIELSTQNRLPSGELQYAGWRTQSHGIFSSNSLYLGKIQNLKRSQCQRIYDKQNYTLAPRMNCLKTGPEIDCLGDQGSPIWFDFILFGIVSNVSECYDSLNPHIYTQIHQYIPWMKQQFQVWKIRRL